MAMIDYTVTIRPRIGPELTYTICSSSNAHAPEVYAVALSAWEQIVGVQYWGDFASAEFDNSMRKIRSALIHSSDAYMNVRPLG